nr:hypothetical protein [Mycoplasmopsis bovis]
MQLEEVRRKSNLRENKRSRIAYEVANRTRYGDYKFAVVLSRTGELLKEVAKFRPNTIIIGILKDANMIGEFGITSSVWTSLDSVKYFDLIKENSDKALEILMPYGINKGDRIIVVENESIVEKQYN